MAEYDLTERISPYLDKRECPGHAPQSRPCSCRPVRDVCVPSTGASRASLARIPIPSPLSPPVDTQVNAQALVLARIDFRSPSLVPPPRSISDLIFPLLEFLEQTEQFYSKDILTTKFKLLQQTSMVDLLIDINHTLNPEAGDEGEPPPPPPLVVERVNTGHDARRSTLRLGRLGCECTNPPPYRELSPSSIRVVAPNQTPHRFSPQTLHTRAALQPRRIS